MTDKCKSVQGVLGKYCPLLMLSEALDPFCDGNEDAKGKACAVWSVAQKVAGKVLAQPELEASKVKASNLHCIDYLLAGKKILLVEDNPVSMKILAKTLNALDSSLLKANHGQEALDLLSNHSDIGLVLLDMDMPVMNGAEFVQALREHYGEAQQVPVILVSELKNWAEAKQMIENGVLAYVKKPYKAEDLLSTVRQALLDFNERRST
jgi:CheY-like chemotaxis protein